MTTDDLKDVLELAQYVEPVLSDGKGPIEAILDEKDALLLAQALIESEKRVTDLSAENEQLRQRIDEARDEHAMRHGECGFNIGAPR